MGRGGARQFPYGGDPCPGSELFMGAGASGDRILEERIRLVAVRARQLRVPPREGDVLELTRRMFAKALKGPDLRAVVEGVVQALEDHPPDPPVEPPDPLHQTHEERLRDDRASWLLTEVSPVSTAALQQRAVAAFAPALPFSEIREICSVALRIHAAAEKEGGVAESPSSRMELSGADLKRLGAEFFRANPDATAREAWDFFLTRGRPTVKLETWINAYASKARRRASANGRDSGPAPAPTPQPAPAAPEAPAPDPGPEDLIAPEPPAADVAASVEDAPERRAPWDYPEAIDVAMDLIVGASQHGRVVYFSDAKAIVASARAMIRAALPDVDQEPIYVLLRGADALLARIAEVAE